MRERKAIEDRDKIADCNEKIEYDHKHGNVVFWSNALRKIEKGRERAKDAPIVKCRNNKTDNTGENNDYRKNADF